MAVADLQVDPCANTIRHDKASRCIDVTCNIKNRDLGSVVKDIEARLRRPLPDREGYPHRVAGRISGS